VWRKREAVMRKNQEYTKKIRRLAVTNAIASSLLEGVVPSTATVDNLNRYAEGEVSIEELIADAKRRHGRSECVPLNFD